MSRFQIQPVATIHTPFKEKFAIPRQPMLAPAARGTIELLPPFDQPDALAGLEKSSHLWIIFLFHEALPDPDQAPRLKVRPPRLGGNEKAGVFATRSSHRPNGIGQSVVRVEGIQGIRIEVSGVDLLDGTPVIDIKPYIPYADCLPSATSAMAPEPPPALAVEWQHSALNSATEAGQRLQQPVVALIEQCLAQDPKPAYQKPGPERIYAAKLYDLDVKWRYPTPDRIEIMAVDAATPRETNSGRR